MSHTHYRHYNTTRLYFSFTTHSLNASFLELPVYPYDAAGYLSPLIDIIPVNGRNVANETIGYITISVIITASEHGGNYVSDT